MEVKNYGTVENSSDGVGLVNPARLNQILRNRHEQNLSSNMAATLLCTDFRHVGPMPTINHQNADLPVNSGRQTDSEVEAAEETPADSSRPVIELGDLTTGAEAEVNRVKSSMIALSAEISRIRSEHVGLASDYQKLTGELRDIKLVLARSTLRSCVRLNGTIPGWNRSGNCARYSKRALTKLKISGPKTACRPCASRGQHR